MQETQAVPVSTDNEHAAELERLRQSLEAIRAAWVEAGKTYALNHGEHDELERAAEIDVEEIEGEPGAYGWGAILYRVVHDGDGTRSAIEALSQRLLGNAYPPAYRLAAFLDGMAEVYDEV